MDKDSKMPLRQKALLGILLLSGILAVTTKAFLLAALLAMLAGAVGLVLLRAAERSEGQLQQLIQAIHAVSETRDLDMRVPTGGSAAFSALGEAINQMLQSLGVSRQELRNREKVLQETLEKLQQHIEARTQELSATNQALLVEVADHRHTAKALQQQRDQAQQVLDTAGVLFVALDKPGRVTLINRKGCEILGYQDSELLGRDWFETCLPSRVRHNVWVAFEQLLAGQIETAEDLENAVLTKSGEERMLAFHAALLRDEAGEILGVLASGEDITERRRMEEALRAGEEQLRTLINAMPDVVCLKDGEGRWVEANDYYLRLFDLQDLPYKGKTCRELAALSERYRAVYLYCIDNDERTWQSGTANRSETSLPQANAPPMIFDVIRVPLFHPDGGRKGLVMVGRDITARKSAEQDRVLLSRAVEQVNESIIITDADGIIRYVNAAFEALSGFPRDRILGANPHEIKVSTDLSDPATELWDALNHEQSWTGYIRHRKSSGQVCEIEATVSPILHESGFVNSYVTVMRDVTNEVRLERQLRQVQKMEAIGTLAGGIAHDFNNILTPIIIYSEMALYDLPEDNSLRYPLEQIIQASNRAKDLVKQILAFSRQDEQELRPMRVSTIVKEALRLLRASIPTTIEIRQTIPVEVGSILADPVQIHQILMNLCTNAAHAMRTKGGVLGITLEDVTLDPETSASLGDIKAGSYVRLMVSDTGHGMTSDVLERVFDPYFTTKKQGEGTGMGLAVVHGIVKRHRGAIAIRSEPDAGTVVQVYFPRIDAPTSLTVEGRLPYPRGHEHILFVDDETSLVAMAKHMLERLGYRVTAQTSSREALESFSSQPESYDLVITDLTMPTMTGLDLSREILRVRSDVPIIMCTGFSELITAEDAKAIGIRELIVKPIHTRQIAETIRRLLDQTSQNP